MSPTKRMVGPLGIIGDLPTSTTILMMGTGNGM
jgi:hypothetical protein